MGLPSAYNRKRASVWEAATALQLPGTFRRQLLLYKELAAMHYSARSLSGHRQFDSLLSLIVSMRAHGSFSPVEKKPVRVQDKWVYDAFFSTRVYSNEEIMKLPVRIFGRVVEIRKTKFKKPPSHRETAMAAFLFLLFTTGGKRMQHSL